MDPVLDTLQQAIEYFSIPSSCREYIVALRWASRQSTAKAGITSRDSPLSLAKLLMAMWQVVNCKNGFSSYEIHRAIGVTQKTDRTMDHRIRHALTMGTINNRSGQIEGCETFIGGKSRNMYRSKREDTIIGTGRKGKTAVNDGHRFDVAVRLIVKRPLTWDHLTGRLADPLTC
jgi:hypothetical protein